MASSEKEWKNTGLQATVCPQQLDGRFESWVPPLTLKADGLTHPFCIVRGAEVVKDMAEAKKAALHASKMINATNGRSRRRGSAGFTAPNGTQYQWRSQSDENPTDLLGKPLARGTVKSGVRAEIRYLKVLQTDHKAH